MSDDGAPAAPAGWYPDPDNRDEQRYWDGHKWIALPAPPGSDQPTAVHEAPTPAAESLAVPPASDSSDVISRLTRQSSLIWFGALMCALMAIGGVGTWATAFGIVSISGTRGDGWIVVGAGVAGLCALWTYAMRPRAWPLLAAVLIGGAGAAVAGYDLHKIASLGTSSLFGQQVHLVHPAWGIYTALGASVAFVASALAAVTLGPEAARQSSNVPVILASIVFGVGAAVAVAQIGTEQASSGASSDTTTSEPATATTPEREPETTSTTETPAVTTQAAERTLNAYSAAYSAESVRGLAALFTSDLSRTDASHPTEDRAEALATYAQQFSELQHPRYELTKPEVTAEDNGATAKAEYTITSQYGTVGGSVTFHLVPNGSGVGIDNITVEPKHSGTGD